MLLGYADISSQDDYLGVERYYSGLAKFISECETPMTISIQGDWGSGKTTALNIIQKKLENMEGKKNHILWFKTWQYSKFDMNDNMTLALMSNMYMKLKELSKTKSIDISKMGIPLLKEGVLCAVDHVVGGRTADRANDIFNAFIGKNELAETFKHIEDTKTSIQAIINKLVTDENERIVVFVDDLDRLEPKTAIELLEGIKNFLDCSKCVFVLAVDSSVIYQGIMNKYGESFGTDKAKKFFDKIIQVPFSLPVNQYNTAEYIKHFVDTDDLSLISNYDKTIKSIIGCNPRSIKRAFNLFKLHEIIVLNSLKNEKDRFNLFTILLIQLKDEVLYNKLVSLAKKNIEDIKKEIKNEEFSLIRNVFDLPDDADGTDELENQELWTIFIEILIETSRVSSTMTDNNQTNNDLEENNDEEDSVSRLIAMLDEIYLRDRMSDTITNFHNNDDDKVCSFRFSKESVNIVIYNVFCPELEKPDIDGFKNKTLVNKGEETLEEGEIGYYHNKDHVTLVEIKPDDSFELLHSIFTFYNIL